MVKRNEVKLDDTNLLIVQMVGLYRVATRQTLGRLVANQ